MPGLMRATLRVPMAPLTILRLTAPQSPGGAYPSNVSDYINGVFTGAIFHDQHTPAVLRFYLPS